MTKVSRTTAIHEAGHAVAAIRTGLVFDHVTAVPDLDQETDGELHWDDLQSSGDVAVAAQVLSVVLLAGPFAEAKALHRPVDRIFAGEAAADDREAIAGLGLEDAQFVAASRDAMELVDRDWAVIERIAAELLKGHPLAFAEVQSMVLAAQ